MTKTVADAGWAEHTIDYLKQALKSAEAMKSDLANLRRCDAAGCNRMFDYTDPRADTSISNGTKYHFCPGCVLSATSAHISEGI